MTRLSIFLVLSLILATNARLPSRISGPWYYLVDGTDSAFPFASMPNWMNNAGNAISLSFMDPGALLTMGMNAVPLNFQNSTTYFQKLGKTVFFSIGGYGYAGRWSWLSDASHSAAAGKLCAQIAQKYSVGIEIDYEGGADPAAGLSSFVQGFRSVCAVGTCSLSMDLYGSPGGQPWQKGVIDKILPTSGTPGQRSGDGNHLDFVNVMVIDGQSVQTAITFWQQWLSAQLTTSRATFGLIAGWPGLGICHGDAYATSSIDAAWSFLAPHNAYGIMSWAVCPPRDGSQESCGDWSHTCNDAAPGFAYLCNKLNTCK